MTRSSASEMAAAGEPWISPMRTRPLSRGWPVSCVRYHSFTASLAVAS
jgi:hypothetical protein